MHHAIDRFSICFKEWKYERQRPGDEGSLARIKNEISRNHHQIVWQEMRRKYKLIPTLTALFDHAPGLVTATL